jgi:hypothetical protein
MAITRTGPSNGCAHAPGCPHDIGPTQDLAVYTVSTEIERRVLTADELAARVTASQALRTPRLPDFRPSAGMAVMRPASRSAHGVGSPARTGVPEPPVAVLEEPPVSTTAAPPDLLCTTCIHEAVCGKKSTLPIAPAREAEEVAPGLRVHWTWTADCDDHLPRMALREGVTMPRPLDVVDDRAGLDPRPIRREHGRESWRTDKAPKGDPNDEERAAASRQRGNAAMLAAKAAKSDRYPLPRDRTERDRVVLEAVRSTARLTEAGVKLGVSETRVGQILREIRAAGQLPEDIAQLLSERNAAKAVPA